MLTHIPHATRKEILMSALNEARMMADLPGEFLVFVVLAFHAIGLTCVLD